MSDIFVNTQIIDVEPAPADAEIVVQASAGEVAVVLSGPVGPAGSGGGDMAAIEQEIDDRIAAHNQALAPIHPGATSGRDFAALFNLGLV